MNKLYLIWLMISIWLISCNWSDKACTSNHCKDIILQSFQYVNSVSDTIKLHSYIRKETNGFVYVNRLNSTNHSISYPFSEIDSNIYLYNETTERYNNYILLISKPFDSKIFYIFFDRYMQKMDTDIFFEVESKQIVGEKYSGYLYEIPYADSLNLISNFLKGYYNVNNTKIDTIFARNIDLHKPVYFSNFFRSPLVQE